MSMLTVTVSPVISYSCVQGLGTYAGTGNIGVNPLFVSLAGVDGIPGNEDDNLRLQKASPCVNTGDNSAVIYGGGRDLDGELRIHACVVDMGAYENQQARFFADTDENCVINMTDYLDFNFCLERFGYEKNPILEMCVEVFDADGDEDVDLADFAVFQRVFTDPVKS